MANAKSKGFVRLFVLALLQMAFPQFVPMLDGIGILVQGHVQVGDGQVGLVERAVIIAQHIGGGVGWFWAGFACRNEQTGSLPIVRHILPDWRWYSPG